LGRQYDYVSEFFQQWEAQAPEWYLGAASGVLAPTTNNAAECFIRETRNSAGCVIGSASETISFLLDHVEHLSSNSWDPHATRPVEKALWKKAAAFRTLFDTNKVKSVELAGETYYCCQPSADPASGDVVARGAITAREAKEVVQAFVSQRAGKLVGQSFLDQLSLFGCAGKRVFGFENEVEFCTCPAYPAKRRCFHTLALSIFLGKVTVPDTIDSTPLAEVARKGNKRKAPPRGAVPILSEEKDGYIADLEAQLRKLGSRLPVRKKQIKATPQRRSSGWAPKRRMNGKTSPHATTKAGCAQAAPRTGGAPRVAAYVDPEVTIRVLDWTGQTHHFDLTATTLMPIGECFQAVAARLGVSPMDCVAMDVTQVPFEWELLNSDIVAEDRVVRIRPKLIGG
jgi:hypothetical protein